MKNNIKQKRYTLRCAVYLFLIKNNKLFLLRRKNTGWKDGEYGVPAGHLEKDETILQAAVRETKEETTVDIDAKDLKFIHIMHRKGGKGEYIDIYFTVNKWQGEPKIGEKDKSDEVNWFSIDSLPLNTIDYMRKALENWQERILFSEF